MPRFIPAILLILLTFPVSGCSGEGAGPDVRPTPAPVSAPEVASAVAALTNAERSRAGLPELRVTGRLDIAARLQADQLAAAGVLEHEVPGGPYPTPADRLAAAGYAWQAYGENIASGYRSAGDAVAAWMESSGHRANILNATFTEIGTAYATDTSGRPYYVQVFARPR